MKRAFTLLALCVVLCRCDEHDYRVTSGDKQWIAHCSSLGLTPAQHSGVITFHDVNGMEITVSPPYSIEQLPTPAEAEKKP